MDSLDPCLLDSLDSFFDATDESLPSVTDCPDEDGEEELEWLADCDAFPTLDSFLPVRPAAAPKLPALSGGLPRVPGRARSKRRRRRNSLVCFPAAPPPPTVRRRCHHCQAEQTPQWRAGPMGRKTLCNACGVRFKSGRLVPEYRPASSPTFSTGLHSNSHRKIMEMRRLKQKGKG